MKSVYDFLEKEDVNSNIDCLIIYSDQSEDEMAINIKKLKSKEEKKYVNFYKIGVKLPENHYQEM